MSARSSARLLAPVVALAALAPGQALAHSTVIGTTPAEGSTVTTAPTSARVTFNEAIRSEFAYARLTGPAGAQDPAVRTQGPDLVATFSAPLPDGAYTLAYRVASEDTHPVSGVVHFTVKASAASSTSNTPSATPSTMTATAFTSPATSAASTTATPQTSDDDGPSVGYWGWLTAAAVVVALGGWFAGRAARSRRR